MKSKLTNLVKYRKSSELQALEDIVDKLEAITLAYEGATESSVLEIPHDRYVELRYNIHVRQLVDSEDILFEEEACAKQLIANIDFDENIVLAVRFDQGEGFPVHTHEVQETLRCLQGSYKDGVSNIVYSEGQRQIVPPYQLHSFIPLEKGFAIVELIKQQQ